jgi:type II secretory pathway pseudopilin PulG
VNSLSEVQSVRQSRFQQQQQQQLRQQPQWQAEDERPRLSPKLEPDSASEASPMQRDPDSPRWNEPMPDTSRDSPTDGMAVVGAGGGPSCEEVGHLTGTPSSIPPSYRAFTECWTSCYKHAARPTLSEGL